MTPVLLIGFILLLSLGLALAVVCFWRSRRQVAIDVPAVLQRPRATGLYRPVARLLTREDVAFLRRQRGYRRGMVRRLRREHRRVLRLYLRSIRRDFSEVSALCWQLSLTGRNANFAALVIRQHLLFHGLYCAVRVSGCWATPCWCK